LRTHRAVVVRKSRIQGRGVFASRDFRRGEVVLEIDDSDPVPDRRKLKPDEITHIDVFIGVDGSEKVTFMKSPEKYVNASCDPNTTTRTDMATGVRKAYALREIRKGDEISWDYAINSWEEWKVPIPCNCGSRNCRGIIRGNYFTLPRDVQIRYLPLLDEPFKRRYRHEIESLSPEGKRDTA
jgi:SET domain-containing protein